MYHLSSISNDADYDLETFTSAYQKRSIEDLIFAPSSSRPCPRFDSFAVSRDVQYFLVQADMISMLKVDVLSYEKRTHDSM